MTRQRGTGGRRAPIVVPAPDAPWREIWSFALTYNAYTRDGGSKGAAAIARRHADSWHRNGSLPGDLGNARAALFFEQRRYHHFGWEPAGEDATYVRALVARIAELSGGTVPGPPDSLP